MKIDDIETICMAHNYSKNKVLKHSFFGSYDLVCSELNKIDTDAEGFKVITHFTRNENMEINGLINF